MKEFTFISKDPALKEKIVLKIEKDGDVKITAFHRYCKIAALTFGYVEKNVENTFGETFYFD